MERLSLHSQSLKPEKFGTFDIFYKNSDSLEMGDVVHGWVEIKLSRTVVIHRMTVNFYGEMTFRSPEGKKTQKFETRSQDLWREPKKSTLGAKLDAGVYNYEFYVGTGRNLPGSFFSKAGVAETLIYYCEATIVERDPENKVVDHIKRKPLNLNSAPCESLSLLRGSNLVAEKGLIYVRNFLDMSGCVAATAVIPKKLFQPGEILYFNVEILNCFRQLSVYVSLVQRAKITKDINSQFHPVTHELYRIKLGSLKSSEPYKQFLGKSAWIPSVSFSSMTIEKFHCGQRLIYMGYSLVVTVKPVIGRILQVEVPIVVRQTATGKHRGSGIASGAATI